MTTKYIDEFRRDAVRTATTSGLTRPQLAADLGVGVSTLNKWVQKHQRDELMAGPQRMWKKRMNASARKHIYCARVRKERRQWRLSPTHEILKKATIFFAGQKR